MNPLASRRTPRSSTLVLIVAAFALTPLLTGLVALGSAPVRAQVVEQDSLALVALYESTNGPDWVDNTNWLSGPVPTWFGVTVEEGRVHAVSLTGFFPLTGNGLSGPIPPELGQLAGLHSLNLSFNELSGPIPSELGQLTSLEELYLSGGNLSGPIPPELGQLASLRELSLSVGGPIPPELGQLASLETLSLEGNMSGPIPPELGQLASLEGLYLGGNDLSGPIPPELGQLTSLRELFLGENQLEGPIPPELGQLSNLVWLILNFNELSGALPPELGQLTSLQFFYLEYNQLSGPIPLSFIGLTGLSGEGFAIFSFSNTLLCEPPDPAFQAWLGMIDVVHSTGVVCDPVANEPVPGVPDRFALSPSYPNPMRGTATVAFAVPEAADVRLALYDVLGREVAVLLDGPVAAGHHEAAVSSGGLPSGVYVVRMTAGGGFAQARRLTVVR